MDAGVEIPVRPQDTGTDLEQNKGRTEKAPAATSLAPFLAANMEPVVNDAAQAAQVRSELAELEDEGGSESDELVEKLDAWSGEKNITPATLGLSAEAGKRISEQFGQRVAAETDVGRLVDGIIPVEAVYNPAFPLNQIETPSGSVAVTREGVIPRFLKNSIFGFLKLRTLAEAASYDRFKRKIVITPELDTFSTVAAVAKGDFSRVVGPIFAHEVTHAYQDHGRPPISIAQRIELTKNALLLQKIDPGLSPTESLNLGIRSRDSVILNESQAYVLAYMLAGGTGVLPETVLAMKSVFSKADSVEIDGQELQSQELLQQMEVGGIPLSRYSENGFPSIVDLVLDKVRGYLPQKDQDDEQYLTRIKTASIQVIKLLGQGLTHRQIADLIRTNYQSINDGTAWDTTTHTYKFLQGPEQPRQEGKPMDDDSVVERFNKQTEGRVMKLREIAKGLLTQA